MFYFVFYIILVYNLHYNIYCMGVDFLKEKTDNFSNENIIDDSEKKLSKKEKIALQEKMEMEEIRKAKKGFKRGVLVLLAFLFFILSLTSIPFKLIKSSPEKISKITVENIETKKFVEIKEKYKIEEFVNSSCPNCAGEDDEGELLWLFPSGKCPAAIRGPGAPSGRRSRRRR